MVEKYSQIIGFNIKTLRKQANLSQKDIARILGVSYQQVQKYESGRSSLPLEKLYRLKNFYDVPYEIFFKGL